jgi:hypothetical protein
VVGRGELIERFKEGLEDGPGAPARATLYTGARGTGKTVMLTSVEKWASARGWRVVSETANPGFVDRLVKDRLPSLLAEVDPKATKRRLTAVTVPVAGGGSAWTTTERYPVELGLRSLIARLTDLLARKGAGLLITLDELHQKPTNEFRELAAAVQHSFREERELAFAGAALPWALSGVLDDEILTFLRRADRHVLRAVGPEDARRALRGPIEGGGRAISGDDLETAAVASRGYPFLIQLVGYNIWRLNPRLKLIDTEDVGRGVEAARRQMGRLLHEPAVADLTPMERSFLRAMASFDGASECGEVAERAGLDLDTASECQRRLEVGELIVEAGYRRVDFEMPYLREYVLDHVALRGSGPTSRGGERPGAVGR